MYIQPVPTCRPNRHKANRELRRDKGQFWTPDWTAELMVAYVLRDKPSSLLDPALGQGVFFRAAKKYALSHAFNLKLVGRDIDPEVISQARLTGLDDNDLKFVEIKDFVFDPPDEHYPAIVANPPYIRHHRLSAEQKKLLKDFARHASGINIDARAGLHVYFFIRALLKLTHGGRLAYIVSADICEGVFAKALWKWVCSNFRLEAIITFAPEASPFPELDTNPMVICLRNAQPTEKFLWMRCLDRKAEGIIELLRGEEPKRISEVLVHYRNLSEGLTSGLSRFPSTSAGEKYTLGDFATVMRGIATGDNEFFFLTQAKARELGIPENLLIKAVGRMRDIQGEDFTTQDIARLEESGRPTRLLSLNGHELTALPQAVRNYLDEGVKRGLPDKALIKTRNPWYRMEARKIPAILFAYLGRRNARFIRNHAGVVPLTCLLCIYPRQSSPEFIEALWKVLSHPATIANLKKVGKSYGGDAIKVEPRALERLPLPDELIKETGLAKYTVKQAALF